MKRDLPTERLESLSSLFSKVLKKAFLDNAEYLKNRLNGDLLTELNAVTEEFADHTGAASWIPIDSISKLRGEVGGRFDTLKLKWQEAGLPLKQKKGDKIPDFTINSVAWSDLEAWLLKMGYASRLTEGQEDRIFEIKKML